MSEDFGVRAAGNAAVPATGANAAAGERSVPRTVADVLREAQRLIAEVGWTQKWYAIDQSGEGLFGGVTRTKRHLTCFCMLGAVRYAQGADDDESPSSDALYRGMLHAGLIKDTDDSAAAIAEWNDAPLRTKDEVLAAFDAAIRKAEDRTNG